MTATARVALKLAESEPTGAPWTTYRPTPETAMTWWGQPVDVVAVQVKYLPDPVITVQMTCDTRCGWTREVDGALVRDHSDHTRDWDLSNFAPAERQAVIEAINAAEAQR